MIELRFRRKRYLVPESWDEMTPEQFLQVVAIDGRQDMDGAKRRLAFIRVMLGLSWLRFRLFPTAALTRVWPFLQWMEEDSTITRQLISFIRVGRHRWYGPADKFGNLVALEFSLADTFYLRWKQDGELEDLHRFVAVLYRPGKPGYDMARDKDGDRRQALNPNELEYRARQVQWLPHYVGEAILMVYEHWRMQMETEHKRIFTSGNNRRASVEGWFPVFRGVATKGTYGPMDQVEKMYMGNLLLDLELMKDEEEELKRNHPKMFK